jgi:hypothetical protein
MDFNFRRPPNSGTMALTAKSSSLASDGATPDPLGANENL